LAHIVSFPEDENGGDDVFDEADLELAIIQILGDMHPYLLDADIIDMSFQSIITLFY